MEARVRRRHLALWGLCLLLFVFGAPLAWAQITTDPATPGPLAVSREEYDFGASAFVPRRARTSTAPDWPGPVELTGSVHYPTDLSGGPYPLIVFMHGRHSTAYNPATNQAFLQWPPGPGRLPIPSYRGYDYTSEVLASHGYIVVSIGANGINAQDNNVTDLGMYARSQLMQRHLDIWNTFNTTGGPPFGTRFVGKIDMNNVGTMGHSRGGEGVVHHYVDNRALGEPYTVRAVLPLAPVDFNRFVANDVPLFVILPYCDGDVSDLQGAHFFDDARYNVPGDPTPKHMITVMGANHNFFNTVWTPGLFPAGVSDDWGVTGIRARDPFASALLPGNRRLSPAQQQGTGLAYMSAFFRVYIGGETEFLPILTGDAPPPPSAMTDFLFPFYHAPDQPARRRDVNRLLNNAHLALNTLGGAVTQTGLAPYEIVGGEAPQPLHALVGQPNGRQPHTTPSSRATTRRGLPQLRMGWSGPAATWTNALPPGSRDIRGFAALQFRAGVNFQDYRNRVPRCDFTVTLTDGAGASASTPVSRWSDVLIYPPGKFAVLPKILLHTIRIPLDAFGGVDLGDVRSIAFRFDQQDQGALVLSDLAFADPAP